MVIQYLIPIFQPKNLSRFYPLSYKNLMRGMMNPTQITSRAIKKCYVFTNKTDCTLMIINFTGRPSTCNNNFACDIFIKRRSIMLRKNIYLAVLVSTFATATFFAKLKTVEAQVQLQINDAISESTVIVDSK